MKPSDLERLFFHAIEDLEFLQRESGPALKRSREWIADISGVSYEARVRSLGGHSDPTAKRAFDQIDRGNRRMMRDVHELAKLARRARGWIEGLAPLNPETAKELAEAERFNEELRSPKNEGDAG